MNAPMAKTCYNLLFRNYPQYEVLRQELLKLFYRKALSTGGKVDCYVNVNAYIRSIYRRKDYVFETFCLVASLINFAAHLREFFASRFSIYARIFLVYGNQRPDSSVQYFPQYDAHNQMERDTFDPAVIDNEFVLLSEIIKYIPQVYFIKSEVADPAVVIREMIKVQSKQGFKDPRLIFSKDLYDYQLIATCPNTHLIRVSKTIQGDKTFTVSYFDFYKKLTKVLHLKTPIGDGVSPELYSLYMTFAGCKDRNIQGLINYPRTNNLIKSKIDSGMMFNGYNPSLSVNPESFRIFFDTIAEDNGDLMNAYNRFCAMDILHQGNLYVLNPEYHNLTMNIVDLYDPEGMRRLNSDHFRKFPLDLNVF